MSRSEHPVGSDEWWADAHDRHRADHDGTVLLNAPLGALVLHNGAFYRIASQTITNPGPSGTPITACLVDPHTRKVVHPAVRTDQVFCGSHLRDLFARHRQAHAATTGQLDLFEGAA